MEDKHEVNRSGRRRLLVTGGTGFVGLHFLSRIDFASWELVIPVRSLAGVPERLKPYSVICHDLSDVVELCHRESFTHVVHLAAVAHDYGVDEKLIFRINSEHTAALAEAVAGSNLQRFIFMSTAKVLGELIDARTSEPAPNPQSSYAKAKYDAEQRLMALHRKGNFPLTILRPALIYGVGMKGNLAALTYLARLCRFSLPSGAGMRSMVSVGDVASAILLSLEHANAVGRHFYLTDNCTYRSSQMVMAIQQELGIHSSKLELSLMPFKVLALLGDYLQYLGIPSVFCSRRFKSLFGEFVVSSNATQESLGWHPTETFYSTLPSLLRGMKR